MDIRAGSGFVATRPARTEAFLKLEYLANAEGKARGFAFVFPRRKTNGTLPGGKRCFQIAYVPDLWSGIQRHKPFHNCFDFTL